tara:strand:- start:587 stop:1465 length:879 start_codon:yes stop_codon:yes gene_type:complete
MKTGDMLLIGGVGLLAFMFMSKPRESVEGGGITQFIPIPSNGNAASLDLFGIADILKSLPNTIVNIPDIIVNIPDINVPTVLPEIDIPEVILPPVEDIDIPEVIPPPVEDIWNFGRDNPVVDNTIGLIDKLLSGESLIDPSAPAKSLGKTWLDIYLFPWNVAGDIYSEAYERGEEWWTENMPDFMLTDWMNAQKLFGDESEEIFTEGGITNASPENIDLLIAARNKVRGTVKPEYALTETGVPDLLNWEGTAKTGVPGINEILGEKVSTYRQRQFDVKNPVISSLYSITDLV